MQINRNLILITGKSASGKSASLRNLKAPEGVIYLGCEAGKELPFPNSFRNAVVTDPMQVPQSFEYAETKDEIHTIVIDSITYLMDMYESIYVLQAGSDTRKAWGNYAQYFKTLMQHYVAKSSKNVIVLAHTADVYNEAEMVSEVRVKVKGSIMNQGVESYFTQVISSKVMPLTKIKDYENPLLTIEEEDKILGYKYVFQTKLTRDTVNERIRSPMGMWNQAHTFIDNDIQKVIDHTHTYYSN